MGTGAVGRARLEDVTESPTRVASPELLLPVHLPSRRRPGRRPRGPSAPRPNHRGPLWPRPRSLRRGPWPTAARRKSHQVTGAWMCGGEGRSGSSTCHRQALVTNPGPCLGGECPLWGSLPQLLPCATCMPGRPHGPRAAGTQGPALCRRLACPVLSTAMSSSARTSAPRSPPSDAEPVMLLPVLRAPCAAPGHRAWVCPGHAGRWRPQPGGWRGPWTQPCGLQGSGSVS